MATRLYPGTRDERVIEKLAEVPQGTSKKLRAVKALLVCSRKGVDYYHVPGVSQLVPVKDIFDLHDIWEGEHDRISACRDLKKLNGFNLYGWGRLTSEACDYLESVQGEIGYAGELEDPAQVLTLLDRMGLTSVPGHLVVNSAHGFCWPLRVPVSELQGVVWN